MSIIKIPRNFMQEDAIKHVIAGYPITGRMIVVFTIVQTIMTLLFLVVAYFMPKNLVTITLLAVFYLVSFFFTAFLTFYRNERGQYFESILKNKAKYNSQKGVYFNSKRLKQLK